MTSDDCMNIDYDTAACTDVEYQNNFQSKQFKTQDKEMNQCVEDMFYQSDNDYEQNKKELPMKLDDMI